MCWDDPCRKKEILAYMVANLINGKVEIVPCFKTWYVNIFCSVFGKMKVLETFSPRKPDFSLFGKFINGKVECATWFKTWYVNVFCFVFGKMKVLEWPVRKNEILAYMVTGLINMKVELVPRCPLMWNKIFEPIWFYIR